MNMGINGDHNFNRLTRLTVKIPQRAVREARRAETVLCGWPMGLTCPLTLAASTSRGKPRSRLKNKQRYSCGFCRPSSEATKPPIVFLAFLIIWCQAAMPPIVFLPFVIIGSQAAKLAIVFLGKSW